MTTQSHTLRFDIMPRGRRPRRRWRQAFRALRELLRHPERTQLAVDIVDFLDPNVHQRALSRLLAHPEGRRTFAARPSLKNALCDLTALRQLPAGSFGRAYLEHLERHGLDPEKLVEIGRQAETHPSDPDLHWMAERSLMTHDLWHVLSGYGADQMGEATLLVFSLAQNGGTANWILTLGANLRALRERGPSWIPYTWRAWRRGRRATCLAAVPYEELLALPLDDVRRAAGIAPPDEAHPRGIVRANPVPGDA